MTLDPTPSGLVSLLSASERASLGAIDAASRVSSPELLRFALVSCSTARRRTLAPALTTAMLDASDGDAAPLFEWLAFEFDLRTWVLVTDVLYAHLAAGYTCSSSYEASVQLSARAIAPRFLRRLPPRTRTRFLRLLPRDTVRLLLTFDHHLLVPGDGAALARSIIAEPFTDALNGFVSSKSAPVLLGSLLPFSSGRHRRGRLCEAQGFAEVFVEHLPVSAWFPVADETVASLALSSCLASALSRSCCADPGCPQPAQLRARETFIMQLAAQWEGSLDALAELSHTMLCPGAASHGPAHPVEER